MFGIKQLTNRTWGVSVNLKELSIDFVSGFIEEITLNSTSVEAIELPLGDNLPIVVTTVASTITRQQVVSIVAGSLPNMLI